MITESGVSERITLLLLLDVLFCKVWLTVILGILELFRERVFEERVDVGNSTYAVSGCLLRVRSATQSSLCGSDGLNRAECMF